MSVEWDYVIVGSGFGGSVSALRLTEKGYRVLVLEKGRRFSAGDFATTNWNLRRWMWLPQVGFRGIFKMTFLKHVTALSGVGCGLYIVDNQATRVHVVVAPRRPVTTNPVRVDEVERVVGKDGPIARVLGRGYEPRAGQLLMASHVADALSTKIAELPDQLRRSLTWDQGKEMARHARFTVETGVPVYFCDPHSPWQRGSNENTNGLLRQYFPKRKPLPLDQAALDAVADELNGRPRQTLGWKTPSQALDQALLR